MGWQRGAGGGQPLAPHPGAAELQQVDGLPADVHVVGDVAEEHRDAVLRLFGNKHVAVGPVEPVCVWDSSLRPATSAALTQAMAASLPGSSPHLPLKPKYSWFTWIMNSP